MVLKEFFAHEIQSFPPSLSDFGKLHLPNTKSDTLKCLDQDEQPEPPSLYVWGQNPTEKKILEEGRAYELSR